MLERLARALVLAADLLTRNRPGAGAKPRLWERVPASYLQALSIRSKELQVSRSTYLIAATFAGDFELERLTRKYEKTGVKAK